MEIELCYCMLVLVYLHVLVVLKCLIINQRLCKINPEPSVECDHTLYMYM